MTAPEDTAPEDTARANARVALIALTAATASLDVTAFLRLGGVFASVMTSNLIFVSVAAVKTEAASFLLAPSPRRSQMNHPQLQPL